MKITVPGVLVLLLVAVGTPAFGDSQGDYARLVESSRVRAEDERRNLASQKHEIVGELLSLMVKYPGATAAIGTTLASAAWATDESLDPDTKAFLASIAIIGAVGCVFDADCRTMAQHLRNLSNKADYLENQITSITNDVGHRLYVKNNCKHPIWFAVRYYSLDGSWRNASWWKIRGNTGIYAKVGEASTYVRTRNPTIYYFAQTQSEHPRVTWAGSEAVTFKGKEFKARPIFLTPDKDHDISLYLTCD